MWIPSLTGKTSIRADRVESFTIFEGTKQEHQKVVKGYYLRCRTFTGDNLYISFHRTLEEAKKSKEYWEEYVQNVVENLYSLRRG